MSVVLGQVITALVSTFTTANPTATVIDGPRPTSDRATSFILVGSTGDDDDDATTDDTLSALGPGTWHDENGEVFCSAWAWSGDTDIVTVRTSALGLYRACRDAVAADRTLGGALPLAGLAQVTRARLRQQQTSEGALVRVVFSVTYSTILTG